ncbi:14051_t:CDS:2, partial [Dentiscutata erythropus]
MSNNVYAKLRNFLLNAEEKTITAGSVIYQVVGENPWISKDELKSIIEFAVDLVEDQIDQGSKRYESLHKVLSEFEISYRSVCSLLAIGAIKTNKEKPLTPQQIIKNINELKGKLKNYKKSPLHKRLLLEVEKAPLTTLNWKKPLASQVISDSSEMVQQLPQDLYNIFMTDSSAENVRHDVEIAEIKAEVVKLRDDNERSNQVTFPLSC